MLLPIPPPPPSGTLSSRTTKIGDFPVPSSTSFLRRLASLVNTNAHQQISDFDDHLERVTMNDNEELTGNDRSLSSGSNGRKGVDWIVNGLAKQVIRGQSIDKKSV